MNIGVYENFQSMNDNIQNARSQKYSFFWYFHKKNVPLAFPTVNTALVIDAVGNSKDDATQLFFVISKYMT